MMPLAPNGRYLPDDPQTLRSDIVRTVAEAVSMVDGLKQNIKAGIERQLTPSAELAGQISKAACALLEDLLVGACEVERRIVADVTDQIAGRLAASQGVIYLCEKVIAKHERKLEKRRGKCTIPPADAQPPAQPVQPPQQAPAQGAADISAPAGQVPAGPLHPSAGVFPAPPDPSEIASLSIPMKDGPGYLPLSQLPAEMWSASAREGVFWSLEMTPLTRAAVSVDREVAGERAPYGQIYLNVAFECPQTALESLADAFGIDQRRVSLLTPENAYNASVACFGPQVVDAVWDVYGITIPVVRPHQIPPLDSPAAREQLHKIAVEAAELADQPPAPAPPPVVHEIAAPLPVNGVHPVVLPELPNLGQLFGQALPEFTAAKICEWMTALLGPVGVNAADLPPCVSLEEAMRRFYQRLLGVR